MPRAHPPPRPRPRPRPRPGIVPPILVGQTVADTFGGALSASMDTLKTLLMDASSGGGGTTAPQKIIGEMVYFNFTGAALLSYRTQYDGWIAGWKHCANTGVGIAVNLDIPSAAISTAGVFSGYALIPQNSAFVTSNDVSVDIRVPFKMGDIINVRNIPAVANVVMLSLCRFDTSST